MCSRFGAIPFVIFSLEVLQTCSSQHKALLNAIGGIDPIVARLMKFDSNNVEPQLPHFIYFQVIVTIMNFVINRCIEDEGASSCVMSSMIWKNMGSHDLCPNANYVEII